MEVKDIDIHELLPQQEPFVMVDRLVHFQMDRTVTETHIEPENLFCDGGIFTPSGVIENIAQTCAARIGYINKYIYKKNIQLGFIGAIKGFKIHRCPRTGETITTTIDTVEEIFGMTLVEATVHAGTELIAESEMKIALSEIETKQHPE